MVKATSYHPLKKKRICSGKLDSITPGCADLSHAAANPEPAGTRAVAKAMGAKRVGGLRRVCYG